MIARVVAAPAALSFTDALKVVKGESNAASRDAASARIIEEVNSSVEHVALRWHNLGTFSRWLDLDDIFQELRVALLTRCVVGFRLGTYEGKPEAEIARIFGRYAIVVLDNFLRDKQRHAGRNWTMHLGSIDRARVGGEGAKRGTVAESVEDERDYPNAPGGLNEREMFGAIRAALSDEHAKIAYLLYEGKSWREVGEIMGENPGTLRDRMIRRAAPVLKTLLGRWRS